ncbi:MAG: peptidylprolyl isomerase [Planctomycetota bacterium]
MSMNRCVVACGIVLLPALVGCDRSMGVGPIKLDVSAGDDSTVEDGETATLSADVRGTTEGYAFRWNQESGAETEIADKISPVTEVGPFAAAGDYKFRVTASNAAGAFGQDFVVVTVLPAGGDGGNDNEPPDDNVNENVNENDNTPPNVNDNEPEPEPDELRVRINSPREMSVEHEGTLLASNPPEGLTATYLWTVLSGAASVTEPTARETRLSASGEGDVSLQVAMTITETGETVTDEVTIEVLPEGTMYVSIAGPTEAVTGEAAILRASVANAPVGVPINNSWRVAQGEAEIDTSAEVGTAVTPLRTGDLIIEARAAIEGGIAVIDDFVIVVSLGEVVLLEAQSENLAVVGEPTAPPVTAKNFDDEDLDYTWRLVSGDATLENASSRTPVIALSSPGTAEFEVTAAGFIEGGEREGSTTLFVTAAPDLRPRVVLDVADFGQITMEFDGDAAPITTANFLHYLDDGFYDGLLFHRSACVSQPPPCEPFVLQGGGFERVDGKLSEREPKRDPIPSEAGNGLSNAVVYSVAMALSGNDPDSATTEFYINLKDNSFLDVAESGHPAFTVFGMVVDGLDVVDAIVAIRRRPNIHLSGEVSLPADDVIIQSVTRVSP